MHVQGQQSVAIFGTSSLAVDQPLSLSAKLKNLYAQLDSSTLSSANNNNNTKQTTQQQQHQLERGFSAHDASNTDSSNNNINRKLVFPDKTASKTSKNFLKNVSPAVQQRLLAALRGYIDRRLLHSKYVHTIKMAIKV